MRKRNLKTFCLLPSAFCLSSGASSAAGFTLIEVLIALIIVTVTISVVLSSQLVSLKSEQKARALQLFRFETQRIFSVTHRARSEEELINSLATNNLCRVKSELIRIESGTNVLDLIKHELTTEALPSFSSVFFVRIPDHPGQRMAATEGSNSPRKE